jgi:hypothetical protein
VASGDQYDNTKRMGVIAKVTYSTREKVELGKAQMQYMYVAHKLQQIAMLNKCPKNLT